jgi:hypothetical protein
MGEKKKPLKISTWNPVRKRQLRISTLEDNIQMGLNKKKVPEIDCNFLYQNKVQ